MIHGVVYPPFLDHANNSRELPTTVAASINRYFAPVQNAIIDGDRVPGKFNKHEAARWRYVL